MRTVGGCLLLLAVVTGCGDARAVPVDTTAPAPAATIAVKVDPSLLTIRPVRRDASPPCADVAIDPGELLVGQPSEEASTSCLVLGAAVVDATGIETAKIAASRSADRFGVVVQLDAAASRALDEHARTHYGERLALLVHGRLVSAPTIQAPEFRGVVVVGDLTRDEAVDFVTAVGGDATVPEPDRSATAGDRALAVCEAFLSNAGGQTSLGVMAIPVTAGLITSLLGDAAIEPWKSLPPDHFVVQCRSIAPPATASPTTICADGTVMSLARPARFLVDEEGRSSEDPTADLMPFWCPTG